MTNTTKKPEDTHVTFKHIIEHQHILCENH